MGRDGGPLRITDQSRSTFCDFFLEQAPSPPFCFVLFLNFLGFPFLKWQKMPWALRHVAAYACALICLCRIFLHP